VGAAALLLSPKASTNNNNPLLALNNILKGTPKGLLSPSNNNNNNNNNNSGPTGPKSPQTSFLLNQNYDKRAPHKGSLDSVLLNNSNESPSSSSHQRELLQSLFASLESAMMKVKEKLQCLEENDEQQFREGVEAIDKEIQKVAQDLLNRSPSLLRLLSEGVKEKEEDKDKDKDKDKDNDKEANNSCSPPRGRQNPFNTNEPHSYLLENSQKKVFAGDLVSRILNLSSSMEFNAEGRPFDESPTIRRERKDSEEEEEEAREVVGRKKFSLVPEVEEDDPNERATGMQSKEMLSFCVNEICCV
jgi:hypothetical protein